MRFIHAIGYAAAAAFVAVIAYGIGSEGFDILATLKAAGIAAAIGAFVGWKRTAST